MTDKVLADLDANFSRQPDLIAIIADGKSYTYSQLESLVEAILVKLHVNGLKADETVGIYLQDRLHSIASIIAIMRLGCAYLPLDPAYPKNRLEYMIDNSCVKYVLVDEYQIDNSNALTIPIKNIEPVQSSSQVIPKPKLPELAYVIYTSGSTGNPKGVMMKYQVVSNLISWQNSQYSSSSRYRTAQFSQLSFDVSFQEIFSTLCAGAELVLVPENIKRDFKALLQLLHEQKIERIFMPYIALLHMAQWACRLKLFPQSLQHVITAGEQLIITDEIREFFSQCDNTRLYNQYGPSETHVVTEYVLPEDVSSWPDVPPIGKPIEKAELYLLNENSAVMQGELGEIYVAGDVLAAGYINNDAETNKRFVQLKINNQNIKAYKTGDLAVIDKAGNFLYKGRVDDQVKISGYRIELSEVESALLKCQGVNQAVVSVLERIPGQKELIGFVVPIDDADLNTSFVQQQLVSHIPDYMMPKQILLVKEILKTPSGKIDRNRMVELYCQKTIQKESVVGHQQYLNLICEELNLAACEEESSLVDQGMDSLAANAIAARFYDDLNIDIPAYQLFQYKSVKSFLDSLDSKSTKQALSKTKRATGASERDIAIIGMSLSVPGADSIELFWKNLVEGNENLEFFEEKKPGSDRVNVRGVISHPIEFDASFFDITPIEAEFIDPQQRIMLEQAWLGLEDAGIVPESFNGRIGVFCGTGNNSYYLNNVLKNKEKLNMYGEFQAMIANEKDYVATRISHKLNLNGPSLSIVTACSTSLVAVAEAVESLRAGACDVAIAGAASLSFPQQQPYQFQEGGIYSKDGHTRTFDENSSGTVFSDGCGIVVLKRLDYAISDRDRIYAVIKGAAINNDGAEKGSYSAPSIEGQKNVILGAQIDAGINADSVGYVEAHGTATPLGDPIEVAALKKAFNISTQDEHFCGLGSVKSNFGHLTAAAGVVGLIKAALMVKDAYMPATINLKKANKALELEHSPFYLTQTAGPWKEAKKGQRIAAVSSFGIGGTNAHVIVADNRGVVTADEQEISFKLPLCVSAKSVDGLHAYLTDYQSYLEKTDLDINHISSNIFHRRKVFKYRCSVVANDCKTLADKVALANRKNFEVKPFVNKSLLFLFPGQGTQSAGMGRYLYECLPQFRQHFEVCADLLKLQQDLDIKELIFNESDKLKQTAFAQPALFTICYALARTLEELGVNPTHSFGHSIGELVSAAIAGVFDLSTALHVVVCRGRVMQAQPSGDMLAVNASAECLKAFVNSEVVIAAYNSAESCVLSGPSEAIESVTTQLQLKEIECKKLFTSHAFHSPLMTGAVDSFLSLLKDVKLNAPKVPFISCVTGEWIRDEQAVDINYWADQIIQPVQFSNGCKTLAKLEQITAIEVGPRQVLSGLLLQNMMDKTDIRYIQTLQKPGSKDDEIQGFSSALGKLWEYGVEPDWSAIIPSSEINHVSLPTYPFQRKAYYIEADGQVNQADCLSGQITNMNQTLNQAYVASGTKMNASNNKDMLTEKLKHLFSDASGLDLDDVDVQSTFFELGFDSLFLTQAVLQIKKEFKIELTFRELLNEYSSFEKLTDRLLEKGVNIDVAPEAVSSIDLQQSQSAAQNIDLAQPMGQSGGANLATLFNQQMQLINSQMQLLNQVVGQQPITNNNQPLNLNTDQTLSGNESSSSKDEDRQRMPFGASVRINVKRSNELTLPQQKNIDDISSRYIQRLKNSKAFAQENRKRLADPRVVSGFRNILKEIIFPIVVEKSEGAYLWDIDGNQYIDITCGFGSNFFGNGAPFIRDAIEKQLHQGYEIGPQSPLVADVSKRFCEMTGQERMAFCNTGSEAVLGAVRLARTVTAKDKIVMFEDDYHGINDEVIVHRGAHGKSSPAAAGIPKSSVNETIILDYGDDRSLKYIRENADEIAAVLVEPIQSRNPGHQPREFLHELRSICSEGEVALIFDEVITGLRLHPQGAQGYFDVEADLATYGKVIGGGMPIGIIAGKSAFMDALDGGYWQYGDDSSPEVGVTYFAGTFVRHPLALASANAVLKHLEENPGIQEVLNKRTADMVHVMNEYCKSKAVPIKIPHCGSLFKIKIPQDIPYEELIYILLREKGIHIWDARPCFLTLAHSDDDIETFINAFKESVDEMLDMDFLPYDKQGNDNKEYDINNPPVSGARLGKDARGNPAWFVEDLERPGKYLLLDVS